MPDEQRAKISVALMGHPVSLEARAKSSAANTGRHHTPEECAKISAAQMGRSNPSAIGNTYRRGSHHSEESKAKMSVAHRGHIMSPETRANMAAAQTGRRATPETRAKLSALKKGVPVSLEARAKISAANTGRVPSEEERAKMRESHRGKPGHPASPETRMKQSIAHWKGGRSVASGKSRSQRRDLGFVPLNAFFLGSEGHHVDTEQVIYMPEALHKSIRHNQFSGRGMAKINAVAYNFLFKQEVETALEVQNARLA